MKRFAACALLLCMLAGLCGCTEKQPDKVAFLLKEGTTLDISNWEAELTALGYITEFLPAAQNQAQQLEQVQTLCQENTKLLIIEAVIPSVAQELSQPAIDAGIAVLFIHFQDAAPALNGAVSFIGYDPATPGTLQAELLSALPDGGDLSGDGIVSYGVLTGPIDQRKVDDQLNGIHGILPKEQMLWVKHTDWTYEKGYAMCADMISSYGKDIEVIFCGSPELTAGAMQAASDAGIIPGRDIYIAAIGRTDELTAQWEAGSLIGSVYADEEAYNMLIGETALSMLTGKEYTYQTLVGYKVLEKEEE